MEETIALAARHVLEARTRVIEQQQRVRALEGLGVDTRYHEYTLKVFRQTLQVFEEHQRIIEERLKMLSGEISSPGVGSDAYRRHGVVTGMSAFGQKQTLQCKMPCPLCTE